MVSTYADWTFQAAEMISTRADWTLWSSRNGSDAWRLDIPSGGNGSDRCRFDIMMQQKWFRHVQIAFLTDWTSNRHAGKTFRPITHWLFKTSILIQQSILMAFGRKLSPFQPIR